jgi:hypothetical protein
MYHGTNEDTAAFHPGSFFTTKPDYASGRAEGSAARRGGDPAAGAAVYDVRLAPERPFSVNGTYSLADMSHSLNGEACGDPCGRRRSGRRWRSCSRRR